MVLAAPTEKCGVKFVVRTPTLGFGRAQEASGCRIVGGRFHWEASFHLGEAVGVGGGLDLKGSQEG
jgi:hypothetical protein